MFVLALASAFSQNTYTFVASRGLFGITIGVFSPLNFTILAEITPKKIRGSAMTLIGLFYVLGELVCCGIAYITTDNLNVETGNWRGLLIYSSFLALMCFIMLYFWLDESPRYNLVMQKYDEAFATIEKMFATNFREVTD